ncbi:MAG: flavin reductase family protein [Armatimonadota bacterium]|nr:flavin reductase family protein [Armatimonadota bacterium]MDW8024524.1 flavin reductase family protein [Armatimonadota bacterium]
MKQPIEPFELWREIVHLMTRYGLLLCSVGSDGKPNVMAIGWMTGGIVWDKPILCVFVRPSRYTYSRLEEVGEFTVNVLPPEFKDAIELCGTVSGKDADKFERTGLKPVPAQKVSVPIIEQGIIHYECTVVHKNDILCQFLSEEIARYAYPSGNFHRVYFGKVVASYALKDAVKALI